GSRGIGQGIARSLGVQGAEVCIIARGPEELAATKHQIEQLGAICHTVNADLATTDGAKSAVDQVLSISPHWSILANCAGNPPGPTLLDMDVDYWDRTFALHCRAPFLIAQALVPEMINGGGGNILNISSAASLVACNGHGAYGPAKSGLNMLTREMALEWGKHNIKANAICPTAVMTQMGQKVWGSHPLQAEWLMAKIPAGRFAQVSDVVELAMFLLGPSNTFVNGVIIPCDGGLLAGYADGPPADG
uniref:SDR family NAD(P)-dependent oxidoreductase n=1 Tax=Aeoliella sp. TaxID=2795800 RepID=UPI003CCBD619